MTMNIDEITVKVKVIEEKKLKAIIGLDFGDFVVKGFRIQESQHPNYKGDKLWLTPPSYRAGGGSYHPIFFAPNKELWKQLEMRVWEEYYRQSEEHFKKRLGIDLDVTF